jgi:C4-dicarboxylate-specific signal transduction histidine kinase
MKDKLFHTTELAFFGKITASVSHELNNVLSIINEYSGLLEDLMFACERGKPIDKDRIQQIAQNISEQIKRKKKIIKLLNRFAHRVDTTIANFDLYELLNDITRLSRRFANLKKVNLEISLPEVQTNITNSPFLLQHTVFRIIDLALENSNSNDTISISTDKEKSFEVIKINTPDIPENEQSNEKISFISQLMNTIGGEFQIQKVENNRQVFKLLLSISIIGLQEDS